MLPVGLSVPHIGRLRAVLRARLRQVTSLDADPAGALAASLEVRPAVSCAAFTHADAAKVKANGAFLHLEDGAGVGAIDDPAADVGEQTGEGDCGSYQKVLVLAVRGPSTASQTLEVVIRNRGTTAPLELHDLAGLISQATHDVVKLEKIELHEKDGRGERDTAVDSGEARLTIPQKKVLSHGPMTWSATLTLAFSGKALYDRRAQVMTAPCRIPSLTN